MPVLKGDETVEIPSWIGGLEKNTPPAENAPGTLADGQNLVPTPAGRMASRNGSRIVITLHNDAGSPAEVSGLQLLWPWTSIGALVVGYDTAQHKCYAWYMTQNMAFAGATEAQSRVDLSLTPSTATAHDVPWKDVGGNPTPQATELFEGIYLADATLSIASRRSFLSLNQTVPVVQIGSAGPNVKIPQFAFAGAGDNGTATAGGVNTLTDSTKAWTVNQFAGYTVTIVGGTDSGDARLIASNTATVLTTTTNFAVTPDTTSLYIITPGVAREIQPYCLETYNNVLFIAGYGDESAGNQDRPEYLRHSFLGVAPSNSLALGDISDGFDKNAFALIGAKGQRITAMKQGRGILLVAKANELYRVSGAGRAYPGFQYAIEGVMNTSGLGCANPNALCFVEGYWYGIGAAGMFRTDGFQAEAFNMPGKVMTMVGPRKADFLALDNLLNAFCFFHPDRRLVLFGVHPQGTTPAQYPYEFWAWDVDRERWQPDWDFAVPTAFFHGNNIPTTSVMGPSAPPSGPVTSLITTTGFTATWTTNDVNSQTEFWLFDPTTSTWKLNTTLGASINTVAATSLVSHGAYQWKVRYVRNGLYSSYTAPLMVQTLINPPVFSTITGGGVTYLVAASVGNYDPNGAIGSIGNPLWNSTDGGVTYHQMGNFALYVSQPLPAGSGFYKGTFIDPFWTPATSAFGNVIGPV